MPRITEPHRDAIVPPDPETWQCCEPAERWTTNTRGFEYTQEQHVPDFDALTEQAMRT